MARFTQVPVHLSAVGPLKAALVEGSSPIVQGQGPLPMAATEKGLGNFGKVRVASLLSYRGRCSADAGGSWRQPMAWGLAGSCGPGHKARGLIRPK